VAVIAPTACMLAFVLVIFVGASMLSKKKDDL
jgi:hypothetical protein